MIKFALFVSIAAGALAASAQDRPSSVCTFDGIGARPDVAEVAAERADAYFGCAAAASCLSGAVAAGDPVLVYNKKGDWTCGYVTAQDGGGAGWIRSKDIRLVEVDPNPLLTAWAGTWAGGQARVAIALSQEQGQLDLSGQAVWHGAGDVTHTGDLAGHALPSGNRLHYADGSKVDSCTIDLTLAGKFIIADDNGHCGGMNVRFAGVWRRGGQ